MNRPDLPRLIRESGMTFHLGMPYEKVMEQLGRFAELAVAAERDACAVECDAASKDPNEWAYERAMAARCAKAIRARGKP